VDWADGYRELAAAAPFRNAIHCLWVSVIASGPPRPTQVLPDACTDLIWQSGAGAFVAGPDTGPMPDIRPPGTVLVGVRFRPGAGGAAFGVPLDRLLDQRVDAAGLPGVPRGRLPGSLSPEEALRRLSLIGAEMVTERPPDPLVLSAAGLLGRPAARADDVAERLGIGERQLRRRCQAAAGYGPRTLARVLRFRRFLDRVDGGDGPGGDLAVIAAETGYADQAHLTRESTRLAGLPPAALARSRR
jgi:AraC-like DNA-binding protein